MALARGAFSFVTKPTTKEGRGGGARADQGIHEAAPQAPARRRGQCGRADEHQRAAGPRRHRDRHASAPAPRRLARLRERALRLRRARSALARHVRFRRAGGTARRHGVVGYSGRGFHRAASCPPRRMRSCTPWRAASWSRASNRRSGLLDETALFLHRVVTDLPAEKQRMLERLHSLRRGSGRTNGAAGR